MKEQFPQTAWPLYNLSKSQREYISPNLSLVKMYRFSWKYPNTHPESRRFIRAFSTAWLYELEHQEVTRVDSVTYCFKRCRKLKQEISKAGEEYKSLKEHEETANNNPSVVLCAVLMCSRYCFAQHLHSSLLYQHQLSCYHVVIQQPWRWKCDILSVELRLLWKVAWKKLQLVFWTLCT